MNIDVHTYKARKCVCARAEVGERGLVWSQTQLIHYLSADKCHQLQLLEGLCCCSGEREQTGELTLLEGRWSGERGGWEVGSQNCWGR